jgi:3-deoxy-D-manno-octulosonic acid kinase
MEEQRSESGDGAILYDASLGLHFGPERFDAGCWREEGADTISAPGGRGGTVFIVAGRHEWALKRYRRGGWAARLSTDRYLWLGESRVRAFREWRLLARLVDLGLPVPRPVAARYRRHGLAYSADLITARIAGTRSLSDILTERPAADIPWTRIGRTIKHFHHAGVHHPDLNAHNIQICATGEVYLLDFDKGRIRPPGPWCAATLARLRRSLDKLHAAAGQPLDTTSWAQLVDAYRRVGHMPKATSLQGVTISNQNSKSSMSTISSPKRAAFPET